MKNNTLKAMGIAIGAALSLMYATGIEAQAAEDVELPESYDEEKQDEDEVIKKVSVPEYLIINFIFPLLSHMYFLKILESWLRYKK